MEKKTIRAALVGGACVMAAMLAVACSGSKKKSPGGPTLPPPVEKAATGNPANYACNHSFSDGAAGPTTGEAFHMIVQTTANPGTANGATLTFIDPATASTAGMLSYTVGSTGGVLIPVVSNTRLAWKNHAEPGSGTPPDNYVDTYEFNRLTLSSSAAATGDILTRIVDQSAYGGLSGLVLGSTPLPTDSAQIAGAVNDCDGSAVKNAQVTLTGATPCSNSPITFPCIAYFKSGFPNKNQTATDVDGQFLVFGVTPGSVVTVSVVGTTSGTATATIPLGTLDVVGVANSVSLGAATPLSN